MVYGLGNDVFGIPTVPGKPPDVPRDQTIKLFRPSGARNPPKSLAIFKRIVLRAQEELEAPTG